MAMLAETDSAAPERQWWQQASRTEFGARCREMPIEDLRILLAELKAAETEIRVQLEMGLVADANWRRRTTQALAITAGRRTLAGQIIHDRNRGNLGERSAEMKRAEGLHAAGDLSSAVGILIDWHKRER